MPKRVDPAKKTFTCEWCSRSYAHASGKSAHEKSAHHEEFMARKIARNKYDMPSTDHNVEAQLKKLKEEFLRDELTSSEYENMRSKLLRLKKDAPKATLDLELVMLHDYNYFYRFMLEKFKRSGIDIFINKLIDGKKTEVFVSVYEGQICYDHNESMLTYITDGEQLTVPLEDKMITQLFDMIPKSIYSILSDYDQEIDDPVYATKGERIITEVEEEDSNEYLASIHNLNSLLLSAIDTGTASFVTIMRSIMSTHLSKELNPGIISYPPS